MDSFKTITDTMGVEENLQRTKFVTQLKQASYTLNYAADNIATHGYSEASFNTIDSAVQTIKDALVAIKAADQHNDPNQAVFPF